MSDWFSNTSSEIPDEMWRAATPMQRQADAAVLWAELTGKHASGCGSHGPSKTKKRLKKMSKKASLPSPAVGALTFGPSRGVGSYYFNRPGKDGLSINEREGKKRLESVQNKLQAAKAEGKQSRVSALESRERRIKKRLARSTKKRENLKKTVARETLGGVGEGALAGSMIRLASAPTPGDAMKQQRLLNAAADIFSSPTKSSLAAGAITAPLLAAQTYRMYRPQKSGISLEEMKARAQMEAVKAYNRESGIDEDTPDPINENMLRRAEERRKNLGRTVATAGALGAALGFGIPRLLQALG